MFYVGLDYHKRYTFASAIDEGGRRVGECRIVGNTYDGFAKFFSQLGGPSQVVIEAGWNWGRLYDLLMEIEEVQEVILSHPYKTRVIAEAQIKTDKLDARMLAVLLRSGLISRAHIPSRARRVMKDLLRQRLFWVGMRTRIRNRVHILIQRQGELSLPQVSNVFGKRGMFYLSSLELAEPAGSMLRQDLEMLESLEVKIKEMEKSVASESVKDPEVEYAESLPGIGKILGNVIVAEIDGVRRFGNAGKLCAYCGLVPTTHSSGGREYHGKLLWHCNKWLKWAFVEASWVAVGSSPYFGGLYRYHRRRGKSANKAIVIVARRLCRILYSVLCERRYYREQSYVRYIPRSLSF